MYTPTTEQITLAIQLANEWAKESVATGNNRGDAFIELRAKSFGKAYDSIIKVIQETSGYSGR